MMKQSFRVAVLGLVLACAAPAAASSTVAWSALADRVGAAIVEAVARRMGDARVIVEQVEIFNVTDTPQIEAVPMPDARTGGVMQFSLLAPADSSAGARVLRVGRATARVRVEASHATAARLIPRGKAIEADDLEETASEVSGMPLRRLPNVHELSGGRALRDLAPGEIVTGAAMTTTPPVRSGQVVRATVNINGVEVSGRVVAAQNGEVGAVIRVFNKESRRELRARVVGDGMVEVLHD